MMSRRSPWNRVFDIAVGAVAGAAVAVLVQNAQAKKKTKDAEGAMNILAASFRQLGDKLGKTCDNLDRWPVKKNDLQPISVIFGTQVMLTCTFSVDPKGLTMRSTTRPQTTRTSTHTKEAAFSMENMSVGLWKHQRRKEAQQRRIQFKCCVTLSMLASKGKDRIPDRQRGRCSMPGSVRVPFLHRMMSGGKFNIRMYLEPPPPT